MILRHLPASFSNSASETIKRKRRSARLSISSTSASLMSEPAKEMLCLCYLPQIFRYLPERDHAEFMTLTPGDDSCRDFLEFRSGKDKNYMGRRFLQSLEQGIECLPGKHMHFIDDVNLVMGRGG